jgi:sigma-B regulation protein RsbU (phosphoserine phosphatase)
MRFRWKLLILLLLISIGPIALMRTIGVSSVRQFRDTLIDRVRQNRITSEHDRMLLIADAHALVLWEARSQVEAALMALAAHAEQLLGNQPTAGSRVLFAADFDAGVDLPGDTMVSTPHFRQGEKGRMAYLPVSYTEPVFHVSSSVDPASVAGDIARLSGMRDTFRRLARLLEDSAIWQNIGLANGLFCEFPGHGSIPAAFDTRHQLWYERAMEGRRPAWTMPFVDPATRQVVLAAVVPLLQSAEEIAGAASIVVPVSSLLRNQLFPGIFRPQPGYSCASFSPERKSFPKRQTMALRSLLSLRINRQKHCTGAGGLSWRTNGCDRATARSLKRF